jgi:antitoxin HigA-1
MTNGELSLNGRKEMLLMLKSPTTTEERLPNVHPGEVLQKDFLEPMGITAYKLSKETGIPQTRISEIVKMKRRITADTALRLSKFFGNSAQFWLGLQDDYDLEEEEEKIGTVLEGIKPYNYSIVNAM